MTQKPTSAKTRSATLMICRMWIQTIFFSIFIFHLFFVYTLIYNNGITLVSISQAVAGTAAILIGCSFALSGLSFYFDVFGKKLALRRYLGLTGFLFALAHALLLTYTDKERYLYGLTANLFTADVVLGLTAMTLLTFMATISNNWAMRKMGPKRWRKGLRVGYIAYALLIIRAYILEGDIWKSWMQTMSSLPPPRLVVVIFAVLVILLRISIFFAQLQKKHTSTAQLQTSQ